MSSTRGEDLFCDPDEVLLSLRHRSTCGMEDAQLRTVLVMLLTLTDAERQACGPALWALAAELEPEPTQRYQSLAEEAQALLRFFSEVHVDYNLEEYERDAVVMRLLLRGDGVEV